MHSRKIIDVATVVVELFLGPEQPVNLFRVATACGMKVRQVEAAVAAAPHLFVVTPEGLEPSRHALCKLLDCVAFTNGEAIGEALTQFTVKGKKLS
jgi:hypothetical protein